MSEFYNTIKRQIEDNQKLLAVLIDPDKMTLDAVSNFINKVNASIANYIFVGGSEVDDLVTDKLVKAIKLHTNLPVFSFPGSVTQITEAADVLLFLSLISGRNPDYLIGEHVKAASQLRNTSLEVIPTGYILIENGRETSVQRVTQTKPMPCNIIQDVVDTALAGQLLGKKLIYLEAGSGAQNAVPTEMISEVKTAIQIPLIVGGGIRSKTQLDAAYRAGADMVVIGTAFEDDETFFNELEK